MASIAGMFVCHLKNHVLNNQRGRTTSYPGPPWLSTTFPSCGQRKYAVNHEYEVRRLCLGVEYLREVKPDENTNTLPPWQKAFPSWKKQALQGKILVVMHVFSDDQSSFLTRAQIDDLLPEEPTVDRVFWIEIVFEQNFGVEPAKRVSRKNSVCLSHEDSRHEDYSNEYLSDGIIIATHHLFRQEHAKHPHGS